MRDEHAPELVHARVRRVDDARRARAQRRQALALDADAVEHRERALVPALRRQRVRAARLAEAAQERLVARVEEEDLQVALPAGLEQLQHVAHLAEEGAHAHVDAERDARHPAALAERDGLRREQRRQVVDAEEPEVLERVQRLRLARAREPGDDDDGGADGRRRSLVLLRRRAHRRDPGRALGAARLGHERRPRGGGRRWLAARVLRIAAAAGRGSDSGAGGRSHRQVALDAARGTRCAVWRPSRRSSSLRAAISMMLPMSRPGRTGTRSSRIGVPRMAW